MKDYPVGKAQKMVLDALGITATGHSDASRKFAELGLAVSSKRVGRSSVPVVKVLDRYAGALNQYGEGETWKQYEDIDLTLIEQWIE